MLIGSLLNVAITWSYSRSLLPVYAGISILLAIFAYRGFFADWTRIDGIYGIICLYLLLESFVTGVLLRSGLKSMVMVNTSILLPAAVSSLNIDTDNVKNGARNVSLISLALMFAQVNTGILGRINSNTMSFLAYILLSTGFIWYGCSKVKLLPMVYLVFCMGIFLRTGSRNAAITIVLCLIVLSIPMAVVKRKSVYRAIYGAALLYSFFALPVMEWGFSNPWLSNLLNTYASSFSGKAWAMEGRMYFFMSIGEKINSLNFFTRLFGEGICQHLGHNLYYQCVYMWGIVGAVLIYVLLIRVFELAYQEVKRGNRLVYGCFTILVGHIILNGADVYLFGSESCQVLPMIIMGIMMQQNRSRIQKMREELVCNEDK